MNQIKAVSLVIPYHKNKSNYLWFQIRDSDDEFKGMHEFAGGKIEPQETPVQAAVREFHEEVGLEIEESDLKLIKIHNHSKVDNFIFYIFLLSIEQDELSSGGWKVVDESVLKQESLCIPPENYIFMRDILKTL
jgi:mutator protein MutT